MPERPLVSVVMAACNAGGGLQPTLEGILGQENISLEFIVVDDGSTDRTFDELREIAGRDQRVKVFNQEKRGLTAALIHGCRKVTGEFIARQDAGDISLPGRLRGQVDLLKSNPDAVMCSSFVEFCGPRGEYLYTAAVDEARLESAGASGMLRGPSHHGSVVMRRDAYETAGGYRREFYFAQDLDLWSRLAEHGRHVVVPEVLYRARLEPSSLSGRYADEQRRLAELIRRATDARRAGGDEDAILRAAAGIRAQGRGARRRGIAAGAYFIGSCLQRRDRLAARRYFFETVANNPFHWKAWLKLAGLVGHDAQRSSGNAGCCDC